MVQVSLLKIGLASCGMQVAVMEASGAMIGGEEVGPGHSGGGGDDVREWVVEYDGAQHYCRSDMSSMGIRVEGGDG